jgi:hypothetical protein
MSVCVVCTARAHGAPLCFKCLEAISDAVPAFADLDVKTERGREIVRVEVCRALTRSRDDAIALESYRGFRDAT